MGPSVQTSDIKYSNNAPYHFVDSFQQWTIYMSIDNFSVPFSLFLYKTSKWVQIPHLNYIEGLLIKAPMHEAWMAIHAQ